MNRKTKSEKTRVGRKQKNKKKKKKKKKKSEKNKIREKDMWKRLSQLNGEFKSIKKAKKRG